MDHARPAGKAPGKAAHGLRGQGDLRHQHDRLLPLRQGALDGAQVDLGLPRAGDAVQQQSAGLAGRKPLPPGAYRPRPRRLSGPGSARAAGWAGNRTGPAGRARLRSRPGAPARARFRACRSSQVTAALSIHPGDIHRAGLSDQEAQDRLPAFQSWRARSCQVGQGGFGFGGTAGQLHGAPQLGLHLGSWQHRLRGDDPPPGERADGRAPIDPRDGAVDLLAAQRAALGQQFDQPGLGLGQARQGRFPAGCTAGRPVVRRPAAASGRYRLPGAPGSRGPAGAPGRSAVGSARLPDRRSPAPAASPARRAGLGKSTTTPWTVWRPNGTSTR